MSPSLPERRVGVIHLAGHRVILMRPAPHRQIQPRLERAVIQKHSDQGQHRFSDGFTIGFGGSNQVGHEKHYQPCPEGKEYEFVSKGGYSNYAYSGADANLPTSPWLSVSPA